jgi:hypothetical protein
MRTFMSNAHLGDAAMAKLRTAISQIDAQMLLVPPTPALRSAWGDLIQALALEPAAPTRVCPKCKGIGMRAASRCGNCWAALERLSDET